MDDDEGCRAWWGINRKGTSQRLGNESRRGIVKHRNRTDPWMTSPSVRMDVSHLQVLEGTILRGVESKTAYSFVSLVEERWIVDEGQLHDKI